MSTLHTDSKVKLAVGKTGLKFGYHVCVPVPLSPCDPMDCTTSALLVHGFSRQEYLCPFFLQGTFLTHESQLVSPICFAVVGGFFIIAPPGKSHSYQESG